MKRFWLSIMAVLLITAAAVPAFAWEFSMTGEFEYRLRYFSRVGSKDLFGDASVQEAAAGNFSGTPTVYGGGAVIGATGGLYTMPVTENRGANYVGFAGPNIYLQGFSRHRYAPAGVVGAAVLQTDAPVLSDTAGGAGVAVTRGGFSRWGSDALLNDQRLTFHPSIRVNNAIRVHGVYTVGGFRHKYAQYSTDALSQNAVGVPPFERYYMSQTSDAAYNTAAIGSWEQVRATIQVPWGTWSIGVKDFPFGTGATLANNTRAEAFLSVIPYGPFRFLHGIWLARGTKAGRLSFNTVPDKDTKADIFQGLLLTYDQGPLHLGAGWIYQFNHALRAWGAYDAPVSRGVLNPALANMAAPWAYDQNFNQYLAYMKYFNGRFFTNLEYYWINNDTTFIGHYPTFAEGYHWYSDAGVIAGPAKFTAMFGLASGPVLNNNNITKKYVPAPINYQVLEPYSYLMFPIYGGGNDTYNADGNGEMSNAMALAGRLDYAVAANLNLFGSFIYAKRLERAGYWAGGKLASSDVNGLANGLNPPSSGLLSYAENVATTQTWKALNASGGAGAAGLNPYVDDDLIGWEARAGVNWKLLEAFTMNVAYSYWQPGAWFDQAYRAFSSSGQGLLGQGMLSGRDPIQAVSGAMVIDF